MSRLVVNTIETTTTTPLSIVVNGAERASVDSTGVFKMDSGYGSVAPVYGCRAWVNFNGTGTVSIRASGNVSSITDNGTGAYTVNFSTPMPDENYSISGYASNNDDNANESYVVSGGATSTYTVNSVAIFTTENTTSSTSRGDCPRVSIQVFR